MTNPNVPRGVIKVRGLQNKERRLGATAKTNELSNRCLPGHEQLTSDD